MKFNKYNPIHILIYLFGTFIFKCVYLIKKFGLIHKKPVIILYGHKLYGNLKSIYSSLETTDYEFYFLTLDFNVYKKLRKNSIQVLYGLNIFHVYSVISSKLIITDHGLHFMKILTKDSDYYVFDANHGLPFQKWNESMVSQFYDYKEVWLSSTFHKMVYENEFNYKRDNIVVTGFGRLDYLKIYNKSNNKSGLEKQIKNKYNIFTNSKLILYAPTWVHNKRKVKNEFMIPKNYNFIEYLDLLAEKLKVKIIFRPHLNTILSKQFIKKINELENILYFPFDKYEEAEDFLLISDILLTDWSSISLDYILLDRPTIFLDVENSFPMGVFQEEILRFGNICNSNNLYDVLKNYLVDDKEYLKNCKQHKITQKIIYDDIYKEVSNNYISRIKKYI